MSWLWTDGALWLGRAWLLIFLLLVIRLAAAALDGRRGLPPLTGRQLDRTTRHHGDPR